MKARSVCVVGLGYIGLPTASFLGSKGYKVWGVDVSQKVVDQLNQGKNHIAEPGLDILVKSAVQSGNLRAGLEPVEADVFILSVPTPLTEEKLPDLSFVKDALVSIVPFLRSGNLVILESTCPVGTTEKVVVPGLEPARLRIGEDIFVAHCPERVLPGKILSELVENDRIVGGINEASTEVAADFYEEFVSGEVLQTSAGVAEMAKLFENTFRDVNIALANELSLIGDRHGIDPWEVIELANRHPRVNIHNPGPGVGGHCIAVDPWFVVAGAPDIARLIRSARNVNDKKPEWVLEKVRDKARRFHNPKIACLGLSFKADVGDLRESPALSIVRQMVAENIGELLVCEPNLTDHPEFDLHDLGNALSAADIVLLLVDHRQFKRMKAHDLNDKILIDTRGIFR